MTGIRDKAIKGFRAGDVFRITRTFTEEDLINFARVSRDYNPVHFDERFAKTKQFKGRICHGLLIGSMITEIGGQAGWLATEMTFRYKKPVYINDTITCELKIKYVDSKGFTDAEAVFRDRDGTVVLEAGVKGILPGEAEKKVMRKMLEEGDPTNRIRDEEEG